ncbi:ABC transporter ATP-binding protein [Psychromicrobium sp. YIM B11713]|uniref:ABC transporter ATP-binding protein n=1 Tax=Psychromicrobium sp. YIM B11713 TaxID=3145233 RepID=UPI00374EC55C
MSADLPPAAVELRAVTVRYRDTVALSELSLSVQLGRTVALLGPSGSGKSTALKVIAGFERPAAGRVFLAGRDVTALSPAQRGIGVVVQSYALFPHLSIQQNVAFGLKGRGLSKKQLIERVSESLRVVHMEQYARRYPAELSGGQQQRIAIARALAIKPPVLLLDEPLSALDAQLRQEMLAELQQLRRELPETAMIYVTHDQQEALALADEIAVMRDARLVDMDTTKKLYDQPPSGYTASFLGGANLLSAVVDSFKASDDGVSTVRIGEQQFRFRAPFQASSGDQVLVAIRPYAFSLAAPEERENVFEAKLQSLQWRGANFRAIARLLSTDEQISLDLPALAELPEIDSTVRLRVRSEDAVLVPAEAGGAR